MKIYEYDEWDFEWEPGQENCGGPECRIYVDLCGNRITGILKNFSFYKEGDSRNNEYVVDGKRPCDRRCNV